MKKEPGVTAIKPQGSPEGRPVAGGSTPETGVEYEELLLAPKWIRYSVIGFFVSLILFFLFYPVIDDSANEALHIFLSLLFFAIFYLINIFLSLRVRVTEEYLEFGFQFFQKRFAYKDIMKCEIYRYNLGDYLGWSIRKGTDGSTMYNVPGDQGLAIKIMVREDNERHEYAFSARRPEVISQKVQSLLHQVPS